MISTTITKILTVMAVQEELIKSISPTMLKMILGKNKEETLKVIVKHRPQQSQLRRFQRRVNQRVVRMERNLPINHLKKKTTIQIRMISMWLKAVTTPNSLQSKRKRRRAKRKRSQNHRTRKAARSPPRPPNRFQRNLFHAQDSHSLLEPPLRLRVSAQVFQRAPVHLGNQVTSAGSKISQEVQPIKVVWIPRVTARKFIQFRMKVTSLQASILVLINTTSHSKQNIS